MDTEDQETAIPDGRVAAGLREALHDARRSIAALIGAEADAQRTIYRQLQRIYELEAIVARLPKTADGVPVTPGMWLWSLDSEGQPYSHGFGVVSHSDASWGEIYYSTEAAALAAKEATNGA